MDAMTVFVLAAAAMAAVSLANGVVSMAHGGAEDSAAASGLMFRRVAWQALAALLIVLIIAGSA